MAAAVGCPMIHSSQAGENRSGISGRATASLLASGGDVVSWADGSALAAGKPFDAGSPLAAGRLLAADAPLAAGCPAVTGVAPRARIRSACLARREAAMELAADGVQEEVVVLRTIVGSPSLG